ncbi:hypothetical protein TSUD_304700 [Trifolium subterraneum]|uniref:Uncharacterized protein n=1 Tax=Trifolium subterraneum TaxID=3900 RepID=A0A2Z6MKA9_TRISU|nr:hypothetical protein TSUD_304700 [Trifolium subterraneum]
MASSSSTPTLYSSTTSRFFISTSTLRRRLPLVGAFCMLTIGISNLYSPLYSSALKTGSKLSSRFSTKSSNFIRMEGNTNNTTVPSIVVYVTVPNKEAGKKLSESIVKEKLAACVNRIQTDSEELLIIKTRQSLLEALTDHCARSDLLTNHWGQSKIFRMVKREHKGVTIKFIARLCGFKTRRMILRTIAVLLLMAAIG